MWADFKAKNWSAVESKIAEGFQSVHPDGARGRARNRSAVIAPAYCRTCVAVQQTREICSLRRRNALPILC